MTTAAIILAAGQGKRMRTRLPKVLHPTADLPLVGHVVAAAARRACSPIVVVVDPTHGPQVSSALDALFPATHLQFATQELPRGTGDAVRAGLAVIPEHRGRVLVLYGDVPLLTSETLARLDPVLAESDVDLAMLTARVPNPAGYGRIVRDGGKRMHVVEHRDASPAERAIDEVNVGVYLCDVELMRDTISSLKADNAQGEYYLTDIVARASQRRGVGTVDVVDLDEMRGVNTQTELTEVDAVMRRRLVRAHQELGVRFKDPTSVHLSTRLTCGEDVVIGVGVQFAGTVKLGRGVVVEGPSVLKDCDIGAGTRVESFCHIEGATVASDVKIGPFARLRPGAALADAVHIGNFVEVKNSTIGRGSKANHLAYLGDTDVGTDSNIGAGTITCNYDGIDKHRTRIGDKVFVGSNSTLVAPVSLGSESYVAAGSTVTEGVPEHALVFGRARQETREGYAKVVRERRAAAKAKRGK